MRPRDAEGGRPRHRRARPSPPLATIFGQDDAERLAYRHRGHPNLCWTNCTQTQCSTCPSGVTVTGCAAWRLSNQVTQRGKTVGPKRQASGCITARLIHRKALQLKRFPVNQLCQRRFSANRHPLLFDAGEVIPQGVGRSTDTNRCRLQPFTSMTPAAAFDSMVTAHDDDVTMAPIRSARGTVTITAKLRLVQD